MEQYKKHESVAALMNRNNVDTDQIIPKQFLKKVERTGFGVHLFHDWRYNDDGVTDNPDFELNKSSFKDAKILVAGDNFGCGSSREHAPWAIADYGFNTIISTSYADIFYNNCFKNGILAIVVDESQLDALMQEINANEGVSFAVDLENQTVTTPAGNGFSFEIDPFRKENMIKGLDDIGLTLKHVDKIGEYEEQHKKRYPWLWA
ncbi:MAG: 3-isopropylmalate dehydratase small subunit [Cycloclasticus sp. symbiont of Poecilosclerida sp. M]|nr:MAG: 3-isopropylmalate dehydratase small subunit [Cycloclasticus sp. symbiont of Poecilosclerida sp. M]